MKMKITLLAGIATAIAAGLIGTGCDKKPKVDGVSLKDDGGGRKPADFPELALDVFKPMDSGIALTEDEIKGRRRSTMPRKSCSGRRNGSARTRSGAPRRSASSRCTATTCRSC